MTIHATAIIEDGAKLGKDVEIGPYCIVGKNVVLGDRVKLHSHVVIDGKTTIGEETEIYPFAAIGLKCQDLKFHGEDSALEIGKRNIIREYVTMHPGTERGNNSIRYGKITGKTIVGDDNVFLVSTHIAHDCVLGNHIIMSNNATLAGHVEVDDNVIFGGLSAVHQFVKVGKGAMIGGMAGVESDVIPYGLVSDDRAGLNGFNLIGLQRRGVDKNTIKEMLLAFKDLFSNEGTFEERKEIAKEEYKNNEFLTEIINFIDLEERHRGLCTPK